MAYDRISDYYFYFIDKTFGLCYLRVPTWAPFRLQFYMNGHNWLATKLTQRKISFVLRENAFLAIDNFAKATELSDRIKVSDLHHALDGFAKKYCPVFQEYDLTYHWSMMPVEYATDIVFKKQSDLRTLYDSIVRTAIHSVKPENIATFLGRKLHGNYQGDLGNNFNTRIQGTRIKPHGALHPSRCTISPAVSSGSRPRPTTSRSSSTSGKSSRGPETPFTRTHP